MKRCIRIWKFNKRLKKQVKKDRPISQLVVLNDNIGITSLDYPILCYAGPIFWFVNEHKLRICYNIKKNDLNISLV